MNVQRRQLLSLGHHRYHPSVRTPSHALRLSLTSRSGADSWRIHIAISWLEMGILDRDDGYCPRQCVNVLVLARVKSSNYFGEEDAASEERLGTR